MPALLARHPYTFLMPGPDNRNRTLTRFGGKADPCPIGLEFVMLDLAYMALGLGGLFALVLYARVLDRL